MPALPTNAVANDGSAIGGLSLKNVRAIHLLCVFQAHH